MIWVAGCYGMLGRELTALFDQKGAAYTGTGREVDITDEKALAAFARNKNIGWIVNCAAYTAVDKAEDEPALCHAVNVSGAAALAKQAKLCGANYISLSTDYVFDGTASRPYTEEDAANPLSVYGQTKYDGENAALAAQSASYILRTSWLYGNYGNNFVHTMLRLMRERKELRVVNDQRGTPTQTADLAEVILSIIERDTPLDYGIYHISGAGACTWYEFARAIYDEARARRLLTGECALRPCSSADYPAKARRPACSVLDKTKISAALNYRVPIWQERLHQYILGIEHGHTTAE